MNYWLVKSEPETYSWEDLAQKDGEIWDGVRNFQARNYLKDMKKGDLVLFYHSGKNREIVGVAKITEEAFPDPSDNEKKDWVAVKLKAEKMLIHPVTLEKIKTDEKLSTIPLLKQSRLSVMHVDKSQFDYILKIGT